MASTDRITDQTPAHLRDKVRWLLEQFYLDEFNVIDGLNQHPEGLTFDQWMDKKYNEVPTSEKIHCSICNSIYRPEDYDGPEDANEAFRLDHLHDSRFWDCACEDNYIWARADSVIEDHICPLCKANAKDRPASKVEEIGRGGLFATDDSWLIAYNISEYYDSLDAFDIARHRKGS